MVYGYVNALGIKDTIYNLKASILLLNTANTNGFRLIIIPGWRQICHSSFVGIFTNSSIRITAYVLAFKTLVAAGTKKKKCN